MNFSTIFKMCNDFCVSFRQLSKIPYNKVSQKNVFLVELQICLFFLEKPKNTIKQYKLFNKASKLTPTFSRQNRVEVFLTQ